MQSPVPHECFDSVTMPGPRGIGGKRYLLTHHLTATEAPA